MPSKYFIKKGWLGMEKGRRTYFYNVVEKEFAVFNTQHISEERIETNLKAINIQPDPDFICETQAAAITLTTKCNMDCPYCYVKPAGGSGQMSLSCVRNAVRALGEQTDNDLVIFAWGGEPTQNPDALLALLTEALKYPNIKVCLVTNGIVEHGFLKKLLSFKNLVFQLSFDGLIGQGIQKPLVKEANSLDILLNTLKIISPVSRRVALRATITRGNIEELRNCLIQTVSQFTNRLMLEHLHTSNGRALLIKEEAPQVTDYADFVFSIALLAESQGIHVKVLPFDHLRASGPNIKMNFLNVLPGGNIVVSNAIIHPSHPHFHNLHIGKIVGGKIIYNYGKNNLLTTRYLNNYRVQCTDCIARTICRGSVQRYLFITNDFLDKWDNLRCQYFIEIITRWMDETVSRISDAMDSWNKDEGMIQLIPPPGKIHYPMFIMKEGVSLSYSHFK